MTILVIDRIPVKRLVVEHAVGRRRRWAYPG
jgi:hypothetical protein